MKHNIAIIGNKDTILGFRALGLHTFDANDSAAATEIIFELRKHARGEYAIIFITEELAMGISKDDYKKLSQDALPAIIPLPGSTGTTGFSLKRIGKMVEQAIGSDIIN